jgi:hypothetical protein
MRQHKDRPYDEEIVLTDYVWWNYYHLMSELEKKVDLASAIRSRIAWNREPEVLGKLREAPSAIRVIRCPACRQIARTPREHLCPWCGHEWHEKRET